MAIMLVQGILNVMLLLWMKLALLRFLKLPQTMQTARGKQLAQHNAQFLVEFMAKLSAELAGENEGVDHKVIDAFSPAG